MGINNNYSSDVRRWVASNFNDVGEFRTADVVDAIGKDESVGIKADSAYISSALTGWYKHDIIVDGFRLRRSENSNGSRRIRWVVVPAKKQIEQMTLEEPKPKPPIRTESASKKTALTEGDQTKINKPFSRTFKGQILATKDDGSMVIKNDDGLFKVQPFEW